MSKALLKRTTQDKNDNNEYEKIFQDNGAGTQQPKALTEACRSKLSCSQSHTMGDD